MIRMVCHPRGVLSLLLFAAALTGEEPRNAALLELPPGVWTRIHEQKAGDAVVFPRQVHGGSCFDTRRGLLFLFGSDAHGKDWTNSPFFFDTVALQWSRAYPDDPRETYRVTAEGLPVCGPEGDHPWVGHTFGTVVYDDARDQVVVACFDDHLEPGRFTDTMKDLWPQIRIQPTWIFDAARRKWSPIEEGVNFFANSVCFDTHRKVVVGYRNGFYELAGEPRRWRKLAGAVKPMVGYSTNCAYDAKQRAVVVFGRNKNSNDVIAYWTERGDTKLMDTPGPRPPRDQHCPMEFHPRLGKTVVLVDRTRKKDRAPGDATETWLYDLGADAWTEVPTAALPFACGMNYNLEYDPLHDVLLLVTGGERKEPTRVWALKLKE